MTAISLTRRVMGAGLAAGLLWMIGAGSVAGWDGAASDAAVVRVSWSARPERIETCVRVSDEELARRPAHMRRQYECEGTTARYQLTVLSNDTTIYTQMVRGGGLRHDRELYVSRDIRIAPGSVRLSVRFVRLDSSTAVDSGGGDADRAAAASMTDSSRQPARGAPAGGLSQPGAAPVAGLADRATREREERERRRAEAVASVLTLDTTVTLVARRALLITYDELARRLIALDSLRPGRR